MYTLRTTKGEIIYSDEKVINILLYYCSFDEIAFDSYYTDGKPEWLDNYSIYYNEVKYITSIDRRIHFTHPKLYSDLMFARLFTDKITDTENRVAKLTALLETSNPDWVNGIKETLSYFVKTLEEEKVELSLIIDNSI